MKQRIKKGGVQAEPRLIFTDEGLCRIIAETLAKDGVDNTVIFLDEFNFDIFKQCDDFHRCKAVVVDCCEKRRIEMVRASTDYENVIAVGGCTVLDFGRGCAKEHGRLVLVPSILSTSCISVNRSVVYDNGNHESILTPIPDLVVISYPLLQASHDYVKWSHSGFGDLFANISATIDYLFRNDLMYSGNSRNIVECHVPKCTAALDWVIKNFEKFDRRTLTILANYLHHSSVDVIRKGNTDLSAAGEHHLFYLMMKQQAYSRKNPTHGELVSIGTLLSARALKDDCLYKALRHSFRKLGLPVTYHDLEKINVEKDHILQAFDAMKGAQSFLSIQANSEDNVVESLLDECYGMGKEQ